MNINTYVDILSFEINFVTLFHRCIYNWGRLFKYLYSKIVNQLLYAYFFISSVGERLAARGGTTRPDEQVYSTNANIVTTFFLFLARADTSVCPYIFLFFIAF